MASDHRLAARNHRSAVTAVVSVALPTAMPGRARLRYRVALAALLLDCSRRPAAAVGRTDSRLPAAVRMKALIDIVAKRKQGLPVGVYSLCSAHPLVIEAALREAQTDGVPLSARPPRARSTSSEAIRVCGPRDTPRLRARHRNAGRCPSSASGSTAITSARYGAASLRPCRWLAQGSSSNSSRPVFASCLDARCLRGPSSRTESTASRRHALRGADAPGNVSAAKHQSP